jgi:hypothetical protein
MLNRLIVRVLAFVPLSIAMASAQTVSTIATFADPAVDQTQPLFSFTSTGAGFTGTLSADWFGPAPITLKMPGFIGIPSMNVWMTMSALNVDALGVASNAAGGRGFINYIRVTDASLVLRIEFDTAKLNPFNFGASSDHSDGVTFFGQGLRAPLSRESFAFGLVNTSPVGPTTTYTAAFTSSAVVPEPSSLIALGLAIQALVRRRRTESKRVLRP